MKTLPFAGLMTATRLTRAGRLADATAFLQRMLRGEEAAPATDQPPEDAGADYAGTTIDGVAETIEPSNDNPLPAVPPSHAPTPSPIADAVRGFLHRGIRDWSKPFTSKRSHPSSDDAGAVPKIARFLAATFTNSAGTRPYKLYVPSGYKGRPVPLIVMLHGCTQSPDDFAVGTRMNEAGEAYTCLIAYPGQTSAANAAKCWNWFNAGDQQRDQGEPALIAGITREIMQTYSVDRRRVYIAGLSAGGAAAAIMGAGYPDLYAAVGVHSGLACGAASDLPSAFAAMRQGAGARRPDRPGSSGRPGSGRRVPVIVFHGDRDSTVHPCNGDDVIAQSALAGALRQSVEEGRVAGGHRYSRTVHADSNGVSMLEQWVIHGAGHAWAGGSAAGSFTDPHGPDATRAFLRFFLGHSLPASNEA